MCFRVLDFFFLFFEVYRTSEFYYNQTPHVEDGRFPEEGLICLRY
ncbi:hypothetical protein TDIS_1013 [Thermosulfurimonas dismutans]|uniref:Uncharacterized protein n=1 Tax=Thermosulfurimonas dismutans TaxID=999894 RepID=A0A179D4C4_9BACT|nr:hypothetical protein TDIS_1013 [Thermosulfurimonas dismutans]